MKIETGISASASSSSNEVLAMTTPLQVPDSQDSILSDIVDISNAFMDESGGDELFSFEVHSSSSSANPSHSKVAGMSPGSYLPTCIPSKEFLKFKDTAECLAAMFSKFSPEERQSAFVLWDQIGNKLRNQTSEIRMPPLPAFGNPNFSRTGTCTAVCTTSAVTPNCPNDLLQKNSSTEGIGSPSFNVSSNNNMYSMSNNSSTIDDNDGEVMISKETRLGPTEELLLQTKTLKRTDFSIDNDVDDLPRTQSQNGNLAQPRKGSTGMEVINNLKLNKKRISSDEAESIKKDTSSEFEDPLSTWKCKKCPEIFNDWITFQNHKPCHKQVHRCDQCEAVFSRKGNLNVHLRTHSGEKPFLCIKCSARFSSSGNLRRHLLTHQGLKPYSCSICNSKFTEKKSLQIHQRSRHTGEKPYVCSDCGQGFTQSASLNAHKLIHSNQKPFNCCKCGHRFRQKSQLRLHETRHAGLKNYVCHHAKCTAAFVTKAELDRHSRSHSGEKLSCEVCGTTFMRKYNLKQHILTKHKIIKIQQ